MMRLTLAERAACYHREFPHWPAPRVEGRWLDSLWLLGNNYRNASRLYGAYPPGYVKRVLALFPDAEHLLHAFSGSLPAGPYHRLDLLCTADEDSREGFVAGNVEEAATLFAPGQFDLVLADPPYSAEDAKRYATKMVNRRKALGALREILEPGGHLVWLDTQLPMYRKAEWKLWGLIGVVRSVNHRVRLASFFERI